MIDEELKQPQLPLEPQPVISIIPNCKVFLPGVLLESNTDSLDKMVKLAMKLFKETRDRSYSEYIG